MSEDEKAILRAARDMEELVETKGWATYRTILEERLAAKTSEVLMDVEQMVDVLRQERAKGSVLAIKAMLALPVQIMADAKNLRTGGVGIPLSNFDEDE